MCAVPAELLKEYVNSQRLSNTSEVMAAMKERLRWDGAEIRGFLPAGLHVDQEIPREDWRAGGDTGPECGGRTERTRSPA
jgi:hypothetical protein